jgi:cell wall-associated NlpC family hydrolase
VDRWVAPTQRGIDRAFAAASKRGVGDTGGYTNTMTRSLRGADLPTLGRIGGLGSLGAGSSANIPDLGGDRFAKSWGDPITDRFNATDNYLANKFDFWAPSTPGFFGGADPAAQQAAANQESFGTAKNAGGAWANIDQWNPAINAAAAKWGVDPNRLKAHMRIESGGDPNAVQNNPTNGNTYGMMQINPQIWNETLRANGIDMFTPEGNIEGAAFILNSLNKQYGSWDAASSAFFTGNPYWQGADTVNGTTGDDYRSALNGYIRELQAYGGSGALTPNQQLRNQYGGGSASSVVQAATSFVGKVPYVLGGIPGKGQTPQSWDCSGFMYWLDQNYGSGQLVMGSHEQYNQLSGNMHSLNTAQPGDLLFFNTGFSYRSGNAASHVGMYIGNGQMVHAANPNDGTIISNVSDYSQAFMGAASMSWSGGGAYGGGGGGFAPTNPYAGSTGAYLSSLFK